MGGENVMNENLSNFNIFDQADKEENKEIKYNVYNAAPARTADELARADAKAREEQA